MLFRSRVELDDGTLVAVFHGRTVRAGGAVIVHDGDASDGDSNDGDSMDAGDRDDGDLDTRGGA